MAITANEIFDFLTKLGSNLPAQMKKHGSGDIPKSILEYEDAALACKANDVFATVAITIKEENEAEAAYGRALDFLCVLLQTDFPRSYSFGFKSPAKNYLPIKGLPKKDVNQFFANAVCYPALHEKIERYARLAMKEFERYTNMPQEEVAMPGSFAVFALGMLGEGDPSGDRFHSLVLDYIALCDDEHQLIHGKFALAYIEKYGFTEKGLELYHACKEKIQYLPKKLVALYEASGARGL